MDELVTVRVRVEGDAFKGSGAELVAYAFDCLADMDKELSRKLYFTARGALTDGQALDAVAGIVERETHAAKSDCRPDGQVMEELAAVVDRWRQGADNF